MKPKHNTVFKLLTPSEHKLRMNQLKIPGEQHLAPQLFASNPGNIMFIKKSLSNVMNKFVFVEQAVKLLQNVCLICQHYI
jgi:hypothetical protein